MVENVSIRTEGKNEVNFLQCIWRSLGFLENSFEKNSFYNLGTSKGMLRQMYDYLSKLILHI